ncbi:hypothetical protein C7974DRAFT_217102 [Boeremia exigua]|uniref:uncharacterized protein n=1 Tax=Boeremia exigua TaxID=749465 RepID=UPI001E8DEF70|nr:uncharacterized protein C7974DRAFT_217102 [Boeremia exigua]KAH6622150.1 hypothetical protein C7974DRAFT_217102 [Boeremia exigua]
MLMCLNTLLTLCAYQSEFWHGRLLSTSWRPPNNRSFGDHLHFFRTTNKHFGLSHEFTQLAGPASPERHPLPTSALAAAARPVTGCHNLIGLLTRFTWSRDYRICKRKAIGRGECTILRLHRCGQGLQHAPLSQGIRGAAQAASTPPSSLSDTRCTSGYTRNAVASPKMFNVHASFVQRRIGAGLMQSSISSLQPSYVQSGCMLDFIETLSLWDSRCMFSALYAVR